METLSEYMLNEYTEPQDTESEQAQQFRITDDQMANWALRKIAKAREDLKTATDIAGFEQQRINIWLNSQKQRAQRSEEYFTGLLTTYYAPKHEANPKAKTFALPSGKVQFRAQQPAFTRDDAALIAWLKERDMTDYIEQTETAKWGELKKILVIANGKAVVKDTGEILDCVTVEERPETIKIEVE